MWLVAIGNVRGNLPFQLAGGCYLVGRAKTAQIAIPDTTVSRNHARLVCSHGLLLLEDLNSANGTFVDQKRIMRCELVIGEVIRFGGVQCVISSTPTAADVALDEETTLRLHRVAPTDRTVAITEQSGNGFTATQKQILDYVLQGRSEPQIAKLLRRSPHTIHTHLKIIFRRLNVHSRAELIVKLLQQENQSPPRH